MLLGRLPGNSFSRGEAFAFGFGQVGKFGAGFFEGFAFHQGFGLGEGVGDGEAVWRLMAVAGVMGTMSRRDEPCALVEELEIGVLAVDAFFAEDDAALWYGERVVRRRCGFCRGFPCLAG